MPSNHEFYRRYPKDELSQMKAVLSCEQLGLLERLRDYSWVNGGFAVDHISARGLAPYLGMTRHRFLKCWATIKDYFTEKDGLYVYLQHEDQRRSESVDL